MPNLALFDIDADGADQAFVATASATHTLTLRSPGAGVRTVQFQVFDPAGFDPGVAIALNPPRKSPGATDILLDNGVAAPAPAVNAVTPASGVDTTMPPLEISSWIVRCVVNGGVSVGADNIARPDPDLIHERMIQLQGASFGERAVVATETTQSSDDGFADAFAAIFAGLGGGGAAALSAVLAVGNVTGASDIDWSAGQNADFLSEVSIQRAGVTMVATTGVGLLSLANATEVRLDNQANLTAESNGGGTFHNLIGLNATDDVVIAGDAIIDNATLSVDTGAVTLQTNLGSGTDAKAILTHLNGRGQREFRVDADTNPVLTVEGDRTTISDTTGDIIQFAEANSAGLTALASTGDMRTGHPFTWNSRNEADTADYPVVRVLSDVIEFGADNDQLDGMNFSIGNAGAINFNTDGNTIFTATQSLLEMRADIRFRASVTDPMISLEADGDQSTNTLTVAGGDSTTAATDGGPLRARSGAPGAGGDPGAVIMGVGATDIAHWTITQDGPFGIMFLDAAGPDFTIEYEPRSAVGATGILKIKGQDAGGAGNDDGGMIEFDAGTATGSGVAGTVNFAVPSPALGGGSTATLGAVGSPGPTVAAQNQWLEIEIDGVRHWVAVWQ